MSQFIEQLDPQLITIVFIVCQIAAVVLLAWAIQLGLSTSPRQQHFVWLAALAAIAIAIPLQWNLPSLQIKMTSTPNVGLDSASDEFAASKAGAFIAPRIIEIVSRFDQGSVDLENRDSRFDVDSAGLASNVPGNQSNASESHSVSKGTESASGTDTSIVSIFRENWKVILLGIYGLIVSLLLARLMFAWLSLRWLKSQPVTCSRTLELYEKAISDVGLTFLPALNIGDAVSTPMVFGVFRPTIAVPKLFESWSEKRQRIVFLHELNHVKRRDAIWDLLARLMSTFYWFHPSVHFAQHQVRRTRETATDAAVLAMNIDPASYATELLEIAVGGARQSMAHAIPMAGERDLKQRIERVLERSSNQHEPSAETWLTRVSSTFFRLAIAASFVAIIGFSVQFTFAATEEQKIVEQGSPSKPVLTATSNQSLQDKETKKQQEPFTTEPNDFAGSTFYERVLKVNPTTNNGFIGDSVEFNASGLVTDINGEPVLGAVVIVRSASSLSGRTPTVNDLFAKSITNERGEFAFQNVKMAKMLASPEVVAFVDSGEMGWQRLDILQSRDLSNLKIQLKPSVVLKGRMLDPAGKPAVGAKVLLYGFRRQIDGRVAYSQYSSRLIAPRTETDAKGEYEFPAVPSGYVVGMIVDHPEFPVDYFYVRSTDEHPMEFAPIRGRKQPLIEDNGSDHKLVGGSVIGGKIVNPDDEPLSGVKVRLFGRTVESNELGEFSTICKPSYLTDREEAYVDASSDEFGSRHPRMPISELVARTARIKFHHSIAIDGIVLDFDTGKPVQGALLRIDGDGYGQFVKTDENGKYAIAGARPGANRLNVSIPPKGHSNEIFLTSGDQRKSNRRMEFELEPNKDRTLDPIRLKKLVGVSVKVVDEIAKPQPNVSVGLIFADRGFPSGVVKAEDWVLTGDDGTVEMAPAKLVEEGTMLVARRQDGETMMMGEATVDIGKMTMLTLRPATKLRGQVTVEGNPVAGVKIDVTSEHPSIPMKVGGGKFRAMRAVSHNIGSTFSGADGSYELDVPRLNYDGVVATYYVGVRGGIPNPDTTGVSKRADFLNDEYVHNVKFRSGDGVISGTVFDANDKPVAYAHVKVQRPLRVPIDQRVEPSRIYNPTTVTADGNGKFSFTGMPEGLELRIETYRPSHLSRTENDADYESSQMVPVGTTDLKVQVPGKFD